MTDQVLHLDFETRSFVNLFEAGTFNYAKDPTTGVICMAYAFDDGPVELWIPSDPFPEEVDKFMAAAAPRSLHAHNAQFERWITEFVLEKSVPLDVWYCTAAQARARALPGALDNLGRCLGLSIQKDRRGHELIKQLSKPHTNTEGDLAFRYDEGLLQEMYAYCRRDVEVERLAEKASQPLTDDEYRVWLANERVNEAGLKVDVAFAKAAASYADQEIAEISAELKRMTDGKITSPKQYERLKQYIEPLAAKDELVRLAITKEITDRRTGTINVKTTMDRDARARLRDIERMEPGRIGPHFVKLVTLLDDAGGSSISKLKAMALRSDSDDRVRGAYIYSGAGQTGRFSSAGLQVHNFPRATAKDFDRLRDQVMRGDKVDDIMNVLSSMLRGSILAEEGHTFVCGDWSGIEGRVLPWLTADEEADTVLQVFRDMDRDPDLPDNYMLAASDIYGKPAHEITKDERQVGKVVVLACGYAGGVGAFKSMARNYQVVMSDDAARDVIYTWRSANPWATRFWADLNSAAIDAVLKRNTVTSAGRVYFLCGDTGLLTMALPSGRILCYPQVRCELVETKFGDEWELSAVKAGWRPKEGEKEWPRVRLYGGLLAENATQAAAADILRIALVDLVELDWPVVGHTHDELLLEVEDDEVEEATAQLNRAMLTAPDWAVGLPLNCEIWTGTRYRK